MTAMALGTVSPLPSGLGVLGSVSKLILAQRARRGLGGAVRPRAGGRRRGEAEA